MTTRILAHIHEHVRNQPGAVAVNDSTTELTYADLYREVCTAATLLEANRVALWLDNTPAWAVADLALMQRGAVCIPVPGFFTPQQIRHLLQDVGADAVLTADPSRLEDMCQVRHVEPVGIAGTELALCRIAPQGPAPELAGIAKVTYTSGSTGNPKGVRLSAASIDRVAESLCQATAASPLDRSLALTPLAVLLENIGSLYAPLLTGASTALVPMAEIGWKDAASLDPARMVAALRRYRPTCIIVPPQLLRALVEAAEHGATLPDSLRFVAVGGAPVAARLLARAAAVGLPVFEGYGLSEAASVVTLNRPGTVRAGSVGRPLPHARVHIDRHGEVHVGGALFDGYLHSTNVPPQDTWPTGDLGFLDKDGFLFLTGRRKHLFITAFGRNVAPEWVEGELLAHPAILQAALFGEARPYNVAVLVPRPGADARALEAAVAYANRGLPDYARVQRFVTAAEPFTVANGLLTGTGRPRRVQIEQRYGAHIAAMYDEEHHAQLL